MKKRMNFVGLCQGLLLSGLLLGGSALAGAAGSGTFTITSSTATQATGNYTAAGGATGTFTLTRVAANTAGYTTTVTFEGGSRGIQAQNNADAAAVSGTSPVGGDKFRYVLTLTPNSGMSAPVIEVVQAPYKGPGGTANNGNSETSKITLTYGAGGQAKIAANPEVGMYYEADGNQIYDQSSAAGKLRTYTPYTGRNAGTALANHPFGAQLRRQQSSYNPIVYSSNPNRFPINDTVSNTYNSIVGQYPAYQVGDTVASGEAIRQFGAENAVSNYKIDVSGVTTLTLDYVADVFGFSGATTDGVGEKVTGETVNEWIGFGARGVTADLTMAKSVDKAAAQSGDTVTYTLRVTNNGTTDAVLGAIMKDPAVTGIAKQTVTCTAGNKCTTAPTVAQLEAGYSLPTLGPGEFFEVKVAAKVTGTVGQQLTNTANVVLLTGATDSNTANNTASSTVTVVGAPLQCQTNMYITYGSATGSFTNVAPISTSGSLGSAIVQGIASTATLGVSADGKYIYYIPYGTKNLHWYDVTTGRTGSVPFTNTDTNTDIQKLALGSNGTGYFVSATQVWTFTIGADGVPTVVAPKPLSYTDASGLTTVPTISGNGDAFVSSTGELFTINSPGSNTSGSNHIDIFKINPQTGAANYYGRVTLSTTNAYVVNSVAALNGKIYVSTLNRNIFEVDLVNLSARLTATGSTSNYSSDLASCSYPNLAPNVTSVKSATVLDSAGNPITRTPQADDLIEYTIVTKNTGTLNASGITLQDAIPTGTTYVTGSTTLNGGAVADVSGAMPFATARSINSPNAGSGVLEVDTTSSTVTSSVTDADDNEAVVKFRVRINTGTTQVTNQASIVHIDGNTNTNTVTTNADAPALTVTKAVDTSYVKVTPDPANTGTAALPSSQIAPQTIRYTITVTNSGTATASGVQVTDTLPAGLTFVSATVATSTATNTYGTPTTITNSGSGQNLVFNVGTLNATEPGKSAQIVVTATLSVSANTTQSALLNTASAKATGVDAVTSQQVRTDIIYPKLTKSLRNVTRGETTFVNSNGGYPGDVLEYCIPFKNYSSIAIQNFVITDNVPSNTTALLDAYGAGQSIRISRSVPPAAPTVTYQNTLTTTGGLGSGIATADLGTLAVGEQGEMCFQTRIK